MGLNATVLGASGYAGGELVRLLATHPALTLEAAGGRDRAGRPLEDAHPALAPLGIDVVTVASAAATPSDVCFSCLPSGALAEHLPVAATALVDLADDHRSLWTYGLCEAAREQVAASTRVANPGCYPTAALLAMLPFARAGVIGSPIAIDALSGISGAGRRTEDHLLFATLHGNATAYGSGTHRHVPEIERGLAIFGGLTATVSFTPHLVPMARGLLVTARAPLTGRLETREALDLLRDAYDPEAFVHVTEEWPATKDVAGSNAARVTARVDERAGLLVCSAAIDNLVKGAAGQALQNANLMLGLPETAGLSAIGMTP